MELKEFIAGTLEEIFTAISKEQEKYFPEHTKIKPIVAPFELPRSTTLTSGRHLNTIKFDLNVSETVLKEKEGGGRVGITVLSAGGSGHSGEQSSTAQRVSFEITVAYPAVGNEKKTDGVES